MAAPIPDSIRAADIGRFILRGNQVGQAKPIIAYWCNYWAVKQILAQNLHDADQACLDYTTNLMDWLEQAKARFADEDAVTDDLIAQAYVEQFANEVFERAENAVQARHATRQTADTYQAAATFLELANIWSPLPAETAGRVKYAKYHAVKILRAIKSGHDPNEQRPEEKSPTESVDERIGFKDSIPSPVQDAVPSVSPVQPADEKQAITPAVEDDEAPQPEVVPVHSLPSPPADPGVHTPNEIDVTAPDNHLDSAHATPPEVQRLDSPLSRLTDQPPSTTTTSRPITAPESLPGFKPTSAIVEPSSIAAVDEEAIAAAQKHAKWAISALNFEDVATAVTELRAALHQLHAS